MKQIIDFVTNINICYLVLNVLLLIDIDLYLKQRNIPLKKRGILLFCCLLIEVVVFVYFNGVFQSVFQLKYLSVKSYLLMLVVVNIITLITINKRVRIGYAILNYTLCILMGIIFVAIIGVILGNKVPQFYFMGIENVTVLIDLSFVLFLLYLIGMSVVLIGYYLFSNHKVLAIPSGIIVNKDKLSLRKKKKVEQNFIRNRIKNRKLYQIEKKKSELISEKGSVLSPEELLSYEDKGNFCINGIECGIIFEDSIQENIIKNYHILLEDIEAPMVNGLTLKENKLLKGICTKLDVYDLNRIDLYNLSILNRVSVEEYNLLKKLKGIN